MSSELRIGVLGLAHAHGSMWARAFTSDVRCTLAAVYESDRDLSPSLTNELAVERFDDLERFLDSGLDAVAITSEHSDHPAHIAAAARRGLHILCEKPLAIDLRGADYALNAIKESGVRFMQGFQMRLDPANQEIRRRVKQGRIGRVTSAMKRHSHSFGLTGWPDDSGKWFFDALRSGGGAGLDEMIHSCDWARWMFGEPLEVTALTSNSALGGPVEDQMTAVFRMRSGVLVTLMSGWTEIAGIVTTQISGLEGAIVEMYTDLGSIRSGRPLEASVMEYVEGGSWRPIIPGHSFPHVHEPVAREFVRCLVSGDEFPSGFEDGRRALSMVLDAYESARSRSVVRCGGATS